MRASHALCVSFGGWINTNFIQVFSILVYFVRVESFVLIFPFSHLFVYVSVFIGEGVFLKIRLKAIEAHYPNSDIIPEFNLMDPYNMNFYSVEVNRIEEEENIIPAEFQDVENEAA